MPRKTALASLLILVICIGIAIVALEQRRQRQEQIQTLPSQRLDFASLPGTWNGTWVGPHHGTISLTFSASGAYSGNVKGSDVDERGVMAGSADRTGALTGTYRSPTLGNCTVGGQLYTSPNHHLNGSIKLYSSPKLEKARVEVDMTK